MPRPARLKGEFVTYHIILRGNEKKNIFGDLSDKEKFLEILNRTRKKYNFHIYAYCLMDNHLHLIIYDNGNDISLIMKSLSISYVMYFNKKYKRVGHLFQGRFKSEIVNNDTYLLELSRYIHNNPIKAGLVSDASKYEWSSFTYYLDKDFQNDESGLLSTSKILGILSDKQFVARKEYFRYVTYGEENIEITLRNGFISVEDENRYYLSLIQEAKEKIYNIAQDEGLTVEELIDNKKRRDEVIRELRKNTALKLKEIGELMGGLSESRISRILRR